MKWHQNKSQEIIASLVAHKQGPYLEKSFKLH